MTDSPTACESGVGYELGTAFQKEMEMGLRFPLGWDSALFGLKQRPVLRGRLLRGETERRGKERSDVGIGTGSRGVPLSRKSVPQLDV